MSNTTKVYITQDNLRIELMYDTMPGELDSARIKYQSPNGTTGDWTANHDEANKIIYHDLEVGSPLNVPGKWIFWAYLILTDGRVHPSTPITSIVYAEGI